MNRDSFDAWRKPRIVRALTRIESIVGSFSYTGKLVLVVLSLVLVGSAGAILWQLNSSLLTTIPAVGGSHTEGIIGTPRFINPLLAVSDADRDLTELVFSGLMRAGSDGKLRPDLARSVDVSEDGLTYTVTIEEEARFHDGTPVTAEDVVFTVAKAQDPALKSPKRANWEGIGVEVVDAKTVRFTLKQPYAPFEENLTMGILPKERWGILGSEEFPFSELNAEPIGTGLYIVDAVQRDASGIPTEYELRRNGDYVRTGAFIERLRFRFYRSDEELVTAYQNGAVDAIHNISPSLVNRLPPEDIKSVPLPRVFGVFFNQSQAPLFVNKEIRQALNLVAPRERIIEEVLGGFGSSVLGPIPPSLLSFEEGGLGTPEERLEAARGVLEKAGWKRSEEMGLYEKKMKSKTETLSFTLSTANVPDLRKTAEILRHAWEEFGASVTVEIFEQSDLSQLVIRPRKYDALLFGEVIGRELDLFAFWHSSQRNDPGLNIALYANSRADKLLVELRTDGDDLRHEKALALSEEIMRDTPAVFLYAPHFVYIFPDRVKGLKLGTVTTPSERFLNVREWFIETDRVWTAFTGNFFSFFSIR